MDFVILELKKKKKKRFAVLDNIKGRVGNFVKASIRVLSKATPPPKHMNTHSQSRVCKASQETVLNYLMSKAHITIIRNVNNLQNSSCTA